MATEYAAPFSGSTIATSQQYRDRQRPTQPDMVDDSFGGTGLAVANSANTAVTIQNGRAIVQAGMYELSAGPLSLPVAANGGASNRFDIVCITYDATHAPAIYARIVQGTPGSGMPALTNSLTGIWDFPIAHYEKQPGGTIVNLRDRRKFSDGCGGTLAADDASGPWYPSAPFVGQLQKFWPSNIVYQWSGTAWTPTDAYGKFTASASQIGVARSLDTKILLNTVSKDTAAGFNAANNRYVFPILGWWRCSYSIKINGFSGANNTTYVESWAAKNGANANKYGHSSHDVAQTNVQVCPTGTDLIEVTALTDYVELWARYNSTLAGSAFDIVINAGFEPSLSVQYVGKS